MVNKNKYIICNSVIEHGKNAPTHDAETKGNSGRCFPFSVYSKDEMNKELICLQVKSLENHDVNHCQKIIILNKAVFEFHS